MGRRGGWTGAAARGRRHGQVRAAHRRFACESDLPKVETQEGEAFALLDRYTHELRPGPVQETPPTPPSQRGEEWGAPPAPELLPLRRVAGVESSSPHVHGL